MNLQAMHMISYGLYLITTREGERLNGQIANTVFQVSSEPPTIAISINQRNFTHGLIKKSRMFAVSILAEETPLSLIGTFGFRSGREGDKFGNIKHGNTSRGLPFLKDEALAYIEAKLIQDVDAGTHTIFIGEVVGTEILREGSPMTYAYYHRIKKGSTPPTAPTYLHGKITDSGGDRYRCTICGYEYKPETGDPENSIPAGTKFDDLPDHWVCPVCRAGKEVFQIIV